MYCTCRCTLLAMGQATRCRCLGRWLPESSQRPPLHAWCPPPAQPTCRSRSPRWWPPSGGPSQLGGPAPSGSRRRAQRLARQCLPRESSSFPRLRLSPLTTASAAHTRRGACEALAGPQQECHLYKRCCEATALCWGRFIAPRVQPNPCHMQGADCVPKGGQRTKYVVQSAVLEVPIVCPPSTFALLQDQ